MEWIFLNNAPIYGQIVEQIKKQILSGLLQPGDKLPAVRELAAEAKVNPNTMQRAMAELERLGLVHAQRTSGRLITEDTKLIQKMKDEFAADKIREFLQSMKQIGLTQEQIAELIRNYREEQR